jgi:hypothetical protein
MKSFTVYLLVLISLTTIACQSESEDPTTDRRKSPIAIAQVNHEGTYAKIVYGQPYKRGRVIFGDLVPYGEVWRTGANETTELPLYTDVKIADVTVDIMPISAMGKYCFVIIYSKTEICLGPRICRSNPTRAQRDRALRS